MAYTPATLNRVAGGIGSGGPNIWHYTTADAIGTVDNTGYFSDGLARGMRVNDSMFVIDTNTPNSYVVRVSAVNATTGVATITAPT